MSYKWENPRDWLDSYLSNIITESAWPILDLKKAASLLADELSFDQLQSLFEDKMDDDGYFKEEA